MRDFYEEPSKRETFSSEYPKEEDKYKRPNGAWVPVPYNTASLIISMYLSMSGLGHVGLGIGGSNL